MKTEFTRPAGSLDHLVVHQLENEETWADFGCDQPNPVWTHDGWFSKQCKLCKRLLVWTASGTPVVP